MDTLVLKLVLTPLLIIVASLAGRRWGPALSGWLIGLPLTSGPVTFFLALSHGTGFATAASAGTLAGTLSECVFCLTYGWISRRARWPLTLALSTLGFALATAAVRDLTLPVLPLFAVVVAGLLLALALMPTVKARGLPSPPLPAWDLPARAVLATAFVVILTALAPALGPQLTGLIAPFPVYASILAGFAHQQQGPDGAILVARGLLVGLFAFASFFLVLSLALRPLGIAPAFSLATVAALAVQGSSLLVLRHRRDTNAR